MMTNLHIANMIATLPDPGIHALNVARITRADLTTRGPPTETTTTKQRVTKATTMLKTKGMVAKVSKVVNMHRSISLVNGRDPATRTKKTIITPTRATDQGMTNRSEALMMCRGKLSSAESSLKMGRECLITSAKRNLQMVSIQDLRQVFSKEP